MKKTIGILSILSVMICLLCSCFGTPTTDNQGSGDANAEQSASNLGNYNLVIDSCRIARDYEGEFIVIVKYIFSNNSDDAASFMWSIIALALVSQVIWLGINQFES